MNGHGAGRIRRSVIYFRHGYLTSCVRSSLNCPTLGQKKIVQAMKASRIPFLFILKFFRVLHFTMHSVRTRPT